MTNKSKINAIILASGGLDSTTLTYWLKDKGILAIPIFINYGQHCANTELETLREVLPTPYIELLEIVDISDIYLGSSSRLINEANLWEDNISHNDLYLPYRNLLILTVGSAIAQSRGCSFLYSAFINSNHALEIDASSEFFGKLGPLLNDFGSVEIKMPFRNNSKYEVAKIGIKLKAPIGYTFSCQASSEIPCGACPNCVDRLDALQQIADEEISKSE